ncbi:HNH endonuclease [Calothrix sp. CCY 0018]|uniref:HNH endonuclease n=1 Tax=Calothrix sp. CCY 0018 TaxID=3103864 RepID=UPI0039C6846C
MAKKSHNPLQKLVRGVIRDLINQANNQKPDKSEKSATKKLAITKPQNKRSRYIPASVRVSVLHRDNNKCVFCGRSAKQVQLEVDHIIPFSKGGSNDLSNLQTLCINCNRGKGARNLK